MAQNERSTFVLSLQLARFVVALIQTRHLGSSPDFLTQFLPLACQFLCEISNRWPSSFKDECYSLQHLTSVPSTSPPSLWQMKACLNHSSVIVTNVIIPLFPSLLQNRPACSCSLKPVLSLRPTSRVIFVCFGWPCYQHHLTYYLLAHFTMTCMFSAELPLTQKLPTNK